ncbi:EAL domain-containing protein [Falsiroseomonas sp. HW251]|uniref:EAL domain-containing protein n=1 Tax=Falsiroseomonas sp. HW251 TaxID=3390998 RepID=UPI003D3116BF
MATDPAVIAAARDAARRLDPAHPIHIASSLEALTRLVGPGEPPRHMVIHHAIAHGALLSAARDRFLSTEIVVVAAPGESVPQGLRSVPAEGARLAEALAGPARGVPLPAVDAAALAESLDRDEITVRFQPVVRLADRRPVGVEALARWERPGLALGAGAFVALAEREGLARALTLAVARRAIADFAAARGRSGLRLAFNVPLEVMLMPGLPVALLAATRRAGLRPGDLLLELTESTEVRDAGLLRRALTRLRDAGFGVLLDDLGIDDARDALLNLPFAGVKLDRSLVDALPQERRARARVERLARHARRTGSVLIAEGVSDPRLWRAAASSGCDLAQGFAVGRPIPPEALPAWVSAWSGS